MELKNFNWVSGIFIISYHILLLILLPVYFVTVGLPSSGLIITTLILCGLALISVTAGYHRFYSHRAYKLNKIVEYVMLPFGMLATQGSILQWGHDHRNHHHYVDTEKDPYNIKEGFWHAHLGWMFYKFEEIDQRVVSDLVKNKIVMLQYKYYGILLTLVNLLVVFALLYFVALVFCDLRFCIFRFGVAWLPFVAFEFCIFLANGLSVFSLPYYIL